MLSSEEAPACIRYIGKYVSLGWTFGEDCEKIAFLFETGKKEEAMNEIRALREKAWLLGKSLKMAAVASHKEEDDPNRCYFCRKWLFLSKRALAKTEGSQKERIT